MESNLSGYLEEAGALEAFSCAQSCHLARTEPSLEQWLSSNRELGARKLARESRDASAAMGRRFLQLAANLIDNDLLSRAAVQAEPLHLAPCFGLVAGILEMDPAIASAAYLQQSITSLIGCCQRLLPLGQTRAHQILWNLKPAIQRRAESTLDSFFTPLVDVASARHASLRTRLFIS